MTPPAITIILDEKRKRLGALWQKLQHAIVGVPLLIAGVHRLRMPGGGGDLLAITEIVVAAVLLVLLARDLRAEAALQLRREPPIASHADGGPEWIDVVAGALLIIEAVHAAREGGKPLFERATFFLGVTTAAIGLLHGRIAQLSWKRREIHIDEHGVRVRTSRLRDFDASWADIRDIRFSGTSISIETVTTSQTITLGRYRNANEIRAAFEQWDAMRVLPRAP
ncbi:MAG: hypothetical protein JWO39_1671 [Gemmatimonadetes bacterium]|nr:hypothetical protein [Gemmatimonadota bacterium]